MVACNEDCNAASATFTTVPSMKAMLDPRIATTRTQRPMLAEHGTPAAAPDARIAASSQGGLTKLPIPHSAPLNVSRSVVRTVRDYNKKMQPVSQEFYRIQKLPPYVFAVINEMKAKARAAGLDIVDMGMGNPDGATPRPIVTKLIEAARNARNHRYSLSKGIPHLREEIVKRYQRNYGVTLDAEKEAIVTIGAKDALAHLLFAVIGPGDTVVSPNPCYPIHQYGVIMAEGNACVLPMPDPASFLNSLEDVYRQSSKPPRMILISFPHNPTTQDRKSTRLNSSHMSISY